MTCPTCAAPTAAADRYCEACGADLHPGLRADAGRPSPPADVGWLSSRADGGACTGCGEGVINVDGYCDTCGRRLDVGRVHCELDLGTVAGVTDRGHRRARNEDAIAVGRAGPARVAVVCDGVSTSPHSDAAAHAAVDAAVDVLLRRIADGAPPDVATTVAFGGAMEAVTVLDRPGTRANPPSCTYVSVAVVDGTVTLGWVGDSRAYWVDGSDPAASICLTVDDSLAGQLGAAGVDVAGLGLAARADALTRWVGADATDVDPHLRTFRPPGPGAVVLCSDGLSRYLSGPADLGTAMADTTESGVRGPPGVGSPRVGSPGGGPLDVGSPGGGPLDVARRLTRWALDAGGADNVAVVVVPLTTRRPADVRLADVRPAGARPSGARPSGARPSGASPSGADPVQPRSSDPNGVSDR